jgi:Polysaccharide lyase family 4, domain II
MIGVEKGRVVRRTMFNFGQPDPGDIQQNLKPRRSAYIGINCEAHNFMFGFMLAPKNPYAVVVNDDGSYTIADIPPGKYTLKAWHPRLGVMKSKITVKGGGTLQADFAFSQK